MYSSANKGEPVEYSWAPSVIDAKVSDKVSGIMMFLRMVYQVLLLCI